MSNVVISVALLLCLIFAVWGIVEGAASYAAAITVMAYVDFRIKERDNASS